MVVKNPDQISGMFDAIAGRYDFLNRLLSGGRDQYWRRRAIQALALTGRETVVDVCAGTADLSLAAAQDGRARRVIGVDFSHEMLRIGLQKVRAASAPIDLVRGDATRLCLKDGSADAATIAFGIRNVEQPEAACREIARVLKPGGKLVILEFALPRTPLIRRAYLWYFKNVLPLIGRLVSRHQSAYSYLPASVEAFPAPDVFVEQLRVTGFSSVRAVPLTFGIVYMFVASKGGSSAI